VASALPPSGVFAADPASDHFALAVDVPGLVGGGGGGGHAVVAVPDAAAAAVAAAIGRADGGASDGGAADSSDDGGGGSGRVAPSDGDSFSATDSSNDVSPQPQRPQAGVAVLVFSALSPVPVAAARLGSGGWARSATFLPGPSPLVAGSSAAAASAAGGSGSRPSPLLLVLNDYETRVLTPHHRPLSARPPSPAAIAAAAGTVRAAAGGDGTDCVRAVLAAVPASVAPRSAGSGAGWLSAAGVAVATAFGSADAGGSVPVRVAADHFFRELLGGGA